ncbi:YicC/YloC family endoribonuclease [Herbivorax sp. ANBcel31]|uniref:YicC/YloC family endoribonuclease n=1 Tax=Herbivorax sp. ANBcel31 TaxID=3069754 RepID=UPI0027B19782|nr:YicC/YloC family endoribonuclease [Herbivorax sp. ANBcel31]MDQ2084993.1 YicC/YloC family endoribonuclease [Herbivorax sp. ANBcel31]
MVYSMTGFGRGKSQGDGKEFSVEIKTVNHRYCDMYIKIPRQISFLEDKIRQKVGKTISRGKADIYISFDDFSEDSKSILVDEGLVKTYIKSMELLRDKYELKDDISVSLIAKFPDVIKVEKAEHDEERIWELLSEALDNALEMLINMRKSEGEGLKADLIERALLIENIIKEIGIRCPEIVKEYKSRLENRMKELLDQQIVDENRMMMEFAIFADRCSIDEELVRLESHINQFRETLEINKPVGRKLDFLLQEMNREINTIGSKANDLDISKKVVEIKSELEKIREQIQNIE